MIPLEKAINGAVGYASEELVAVMPNTSKKFVGYMVLGSIKSNPMAAVKPYESFLRMVNILTDDGIDEVALRNSLYEAFAKVPEIEMFGFKFNRSDVDKLIPRIVRGA